MTDTIRFPYNHTMPSAPSESNQIITVLNAKTVQLARGGEQSYASVAAWKTAGESTEAPYTCVVIEVSANVAGTIGNGTTDMIGLYGQINLVDTPTNNTQRKRTLLGIIGLNIGNNMPQIPIVQQAAAANDLVGFSQVFNNIAAYDQLSVGGVLGNVALAEGVQVTVTARPLRIRNYLG